MSGSRATVDAVTTNPVLNIVIAVAVVALVLVRQLRKRPVKQDSRPMLLVVLGVIGLIDLAQYISAHPVRGQDVVLLVGSLVLAAVFGTIRAYTMRLWRENGVLYVQGTFVTVLLWLVSIGVHFGADLLVGDSAAAKGLATTSLLLYVAVTFGVQRFVVTSRARTQVPAVR